MKIIHKINVLVLIAFALFINSCKEVGPQIDLTNGKHNVLLDTTYVESPVQAAEPKNVLIELFTGVQCINCPAAHVVLENLQTANPRRVIGVALHSIGTSAQDDPLPDSKQSLSSQDAQNIISQFGDPNARPVGSVDRVLHNTFGPPANIYDLASNWGAHVATQLALTTPVNIVLTKTFDATTKALAINVELHYTTDQNDSNKLTIFLTQDSIVTSQLQSDNSDDTTYVHNEILRAAVTNTLGDKINANLKAGTVVRRILSYTISNPLWKPEHMHIVAFVHKYQNGISEILQTQTIAVQ